MINVNESEIQKLTEDSLTFLDARAGWQATGIITTPAEYEAGAGLLKEIKSRIVLLDDKRKEMTRPLDESKKRILDLFRGPIDNYEKAKQFIMRALVSYQAEQEKKRREEEAKMRELAQKEEERQKKLLEKQAVKAEARGDIDRAEELRSKKEEVFAPAVIVESNVPKVAGTASRANWKFEITNAKEVPPEYWMLDLQKIGATVRATKGTLPITGVRIYEEQTIISRR